MVPASHIKVGVGDEGLTVALVRLPYLGGPDAGRPVGGLYLEKNGEIGLAVDARLSAEEVRAFMADELSRHADVIARELARRATARKPEPTSA